jgi:hypothetical protein
MLEANEYLFLWGVYIAAGILMMMVVWKVSSFLHWSVIQLPFRGICALVIFTPLQVTENGDLAPAFGSFMLNLILKDDSLLMVPKEAYTYGVITLFVILGLHLLTKFKSTDPRGVSVATEQSAEDSLSAFHNIKPEPGLARQKRQPKIKRGSDSDEDDALLNVTDFLKKNHK